VIGAFLARIVSAFRRVLLPLAAYYAVTVAIPLANGAAQAGARFWPHALAVLLVPLLIVGLVVSTAHIVLAVLARCPGTAAAGQGTPTGRVDPSRKTSVAARRATHRVVTQGDGPTVSGFAALR
jgi:hypothetical protein